MFFQGLLPCPVTLRESDKSMCGKEKPISNQDPEDQADRAPEMVAQGFWVSVGVLGPDAWELC